MNLLRTYYWKQKWEILWIVGLKTLATMVRLFIPWAFAYLTEHILNFRSERVILKWGSYMLGFAIGSFLLNIVVFNLNAKFVVKLSNRIRADVFKKACYMECEQVDQLGISSVVSRLTSDIMSVQLFSSKIMTKGIATVTTFLGSVFAAGALDLKLTVVLILTIPFIILTIYITTKVGLGRFLLTKKVNDTLVKSIRENVMGIRVIRALSKFEYEEQKFAQISEELKDRNYKASMVDAVGSPTMKLFVNVGMVITLLCGAYFIDQGTSQITTLIAFMSYFTMILTSLVNIGQLFTMYAKAGAAANRIEEVLRTEPRRYPTNSAEHATSNKATMNSPYHIEFRKVSFSYQQGKQVLQNISFAVKEGETLGIMGVTGGGKSTIMSLLLRLYEPDEGEILIYGKSINAYTAEALYAMFGTVFQGDVVFAESVAQNIDFGRGYGATQITAAAKVAQAEAFVSQLAEGYDTKIKIRGQNLSGGEKQRLLLARALVGNPKILLLDDSTTALDYKTDAALRKELATHYQQTTKIIISSRIASIRSAEQILVLEQGTVLDQGVHQDLSNRCTVYQHLRDLQLGDSSLYAQEGN